MMTDNDKMIDNEMMKMKRGQLKCQINNMFAMMCEDPRVKTNHTRANFNEKRER